MVPFANVRVRRRGRSHETTERSLLAFELPTVVLRSETPSPGENVALVAYVAPSFGPDDCVRVSRAWSAYRDVLSP